jgi:predicted O-methyltransferase YrrM
LESTLMPHDPALAHALQTSDEAKLPSIAVSPLQGKFLYLIALIAGARRVLEIGTLGGYSTIWLARALSPSGKVITLEIEPKHAEVAQGNVERARVADRVEIIVGDALTSMKALEGKPAFDLVFIDADKERIPEYFEATLKLSKPGTVIVVDNVVLKGRLVEKGLMHPQILGVREFLETAGHDARVEVTALQTVGAKDHDGFALLRVK